MPKKLELSDDDARSFAKLFKFAKKWSTENQWAVGVVEMAVGAGLVALGVHNGFIEMGSQLIATELGGSNAESIAGAAGGAGIGAIAGSIIGSIGVAGMGGAIGIPAALVIGGAAVVLGMAGYAVGDIIHNFTNAVDIHDIAVNGSVLLVGVALIIDGARRCIQDPIVLSTLSAFKEKAVVLNDLTSKIIATSMRELQGFAEKDNGTGSVVLGAGLGASAGGAIAASSVTVLGSQALGGVGLSLGLISAPIWPIVAGVAGGAGIGYAAYKTIKYWRNRPEEENS
jgi:hypothetical protein